MEVIYSSIKDIEGLLKAIADESRLKIIFMLVEMNEACVRDIQQVLRVPQPTVSRHLGYLKRMGLVDNHRKGKWNYYFVVKTLPEVVRRQVQLLKTDAAYRKIFGQEMQPLMDKLQQKPKGRR
jgi:ArsR family transcriptional regulator